MYIPFYYFRQQKGKVDAVTPPAAHPKEAMDTPPYDTARQCDAYTRNHIGRLTT